LNLRIDPRAVAMVIVQQHWLSSVSVDGLVGGIAVPLLVVFVVAVAVYSIFGFLELTLSIVTLSSGWLVTVGCSYLSMWSTSGSYPKDISQDRQRSVGIRQVHCSAYESVEFMLHWVDSAQPRRPHFGIKQSKLR
jgi:hypothetical protein